MKARIKLLFEKWIRKSVICFFLGTVVWLNIHRFQDNLYANYEKTVEYGRVREKKENVDPVMVVAFYDDTKSSQKTVTSYINHFEQYDKQSVRMMAFPANISEKNVMLVENLFGALVQGNFFKEMTLVYEKKQDAEQYKKLLQRIGYSYNIETLQLSENDANAEQHIDEKLQKKDILIVFLINSELQTEEDKFDFLMEEAVYFAQKYNFKLNTFDMVDSSFARVAHQDYTTLLSLTKTPLRDRLSWQKYNLGVFLTNYKTELFKYFMQNLSINNKKTKWPRKNLRSYRLFDRGDVYVKLLDENFAEIFSYGRVERNESVVVTLINIAKKASRRVNLQNVKYIKLYLLTELERINYSHDRLLADYLSDDDGVLVRYEKFYAIMLPEDKPDKAEVLVDVLRQKAGVPMSADIRDIQFFKFKTVEAEYEN